MASRNIILLFILLSNSYQAFAQCGLDRTIPIADLSTRYAYIKIANATIDDLGSAGQGVCGINMRFRHASVGDINLQLSAPNGKIYQLIRSGGSRSTTGTLWNIRFVPCTETPMPDQGNFIKPVWDSDQDWGQNNSYNGTYHAEACLDLINSGPVNGIWTLTIRDVTGTGAGEIEAFSIEFCDSRGIDCSECLRSGGVIDRDTTFVCGGDPSLSTIRIFPTYSGTEPDPADYDYQFVVVNGGIIRQIADLPDLRSALAGDYLIYGISVAKDDLPTLMTYIGQSYGSLTNALAANRLGFCAGLSSGLKIYRILSDPDPRTIVNAYVCSGAPITFDGKSITQPGIYTATFTSVAGCDSTVELHVQDFNVQNGITNAGVLTCSNKPLSLSWQNMQFDPAPSLHWFTRDGSILSGERTSSIDIDLPGTYQLAIRQSGCADTIGINVHSDGTLPELMIDDIVMNCDANIGQLRPVSNAISFSWSGPFGFSSTNSNIDVTEPGEYILTAVGVNCAVRKRVQVSADFNRPENITVNGGAIRCANDSVQISASSSTANVSYEWTGPNGFTSFQQNPWVYEAGIYIVRVGAGGCAEERKVEVHNLFDRPTIAITGATLDCTGDAKRITTSVNDSRASFLWSGPNGYTSAARSPSVKTPGTYSVTVTDVNGCLYAATATVSIDTVKPTVSVSDINLACTQNEFNLAATHSSLHPPTFRWTGPGNFVSTDLNALANQVGTYTIVVTDPVNSCSARASLNVIADPRQPVLDTKHGNMNCLRLRDTLIVMGNCAGGCIYEWEGPAGPIADTNDSIFITKRGQYEVKVTDMSSGCFSWAGFLVRKDTIPLARTVRVVPIGCTTEGTVTLDNTNQITNYQWVDTLSGDRFDQVKVVSTSVPRVLRLESRDRNGCLDTNEYSIPIRDDVPLLNIRTDSIDCALDSVVLSATVSNYSINQISSYRWTFADGGQSSRAGPRVGTPGPATLHVVMSNGCEGAAQAVVDTDYVKPILHALGGGFACRDSGIYLQLSVDRPALSTYWTGPNGFQSYASSPLARLPGIYTLDILGYNGCPAQDTAIVYYTDPLPNLSALGDTIDCIDTVGNVAFMTDAAPGYSFRWLDPGGRINNNAAIQTTLVGPYQIEIVDINGCLAIARAEIDIDTISVGQMITGGIISCLEPSTQLTLDTIYPFLGYSWSFDSLFVSDQPEPLVDTGGIFTLTTTNINGCQRHINYQVEADTVSPDFDLADHDLNCENTRLTLGPSRTNGSWSYFWTGPGDFTLNKPFPTITGPGRYTLTATGPNGCSRSVSSDIHADFEAPVVTLDSTFLPCNSDSASLSFVTTDSLKETNWFGPDGYYRSTVDAATDAAGWYYILAKGFNGCEALDSQFVSAVPLLAPLSISSQKIDCTHSTGYVQIDSSYADYRYLILTESNDTITSGFTQALDAQTYRIVAEHLPSGCVLQDSIDIPADTMPPFLRILEMDSIICEHREIRLGSEVDTAVLYQWSTLDGRLIGPTQNEVARLDVPGTYTLTVSSISNDCISESSVLIEEKFSNLQQMFLSANDASCDGEDDAIIIIDSILGGQGPFTFSINDEYFSSRNVFPFLHPDLYRIYLKDVNGCALDTTIMVGRYPDFSLSLGDDEIFVNLGDSVTLQASVGLNPLDIERITWLLPDSVSCQDCLEQQLFPTDNRSYLVSVTSVNGCTRQDTVFIRVADPDRIFVPNAFTPNGDGINDFAEVFTGNEVEFISSFEVYDRWGNSVFLASDFSPGAVNARWDGSYRGQPLNPGVYIYLLKVVDIRGTVKSKVGEINLLR